jgi:hypothetical protein
MSLCASCGMRLAGDAALCPHHHFVYGHDDWAVTNRIICDFLHRKKVPSRLTPSERDDSWAYTSEAALEQGPRI